MFKDLEGQTDALTSDCIELAWFMRGAISYHDFLDLTPNERKLVGKFLKKRLETEGKRANPVY